MARIGGVQHQFHFRGGDAPPGEAFLESRAGGNQAIGQRAGCFFDRLHQREQAFSLIFTPFCAEKLHRKIVQVQHQRRAGQPVQQAGKNQKIGHVMGLDGVKATAKRQALELKERGQRETKGNPEVLADILLGGLAGDPPGGHPAQALHGRLGFAPLTDHVNGDAGAFQRRRLAPHPLVFGIKRHDDHADTFHLLFTLKKGRKGPKGPKGRQGIRARHHLSLFTIYHSPFPPYAVASQGRVSSSRSTSWRSRKPRCHSSKERRAKMWRR